MGCIFSLGTDEEWQLKILCGLEEAQLNNAQGCLPFTPQEFLTILKEAAWDSGRCFRLLAGGIRL